jgi:hypothetical protein
VRTAREWLVEMDFEAADQFDSLVARVGYDKAVECRAMMRRVTENLLDALGSTRLSDESLHRLLRTVSSIAIDNTFPYERR